VTLVLGVIASLIAVWLIGAWGRARGWFGTARLQRRVDRDLLTRARAAGLSNFYGSRTDYTRYRGAPRLTDYLATARHTIMVAGYWMAHGNEAENVAASLAQLLDNRRELSATIAIIDPTSPHLSQLADYLGLPEAEVRDRIVASLRSLHFARLSASADAQKRFDLRVYRDLPMASVILLDVESDEGRVQLDFKAFRAPRDSSFGLELRGPNSPLYGVCRDAWSDLIARAAAFDPAVHLAHDASPEP
jgi:hypothetical protein